MKKEKVRRMAAGMLVLAIMTGCGSNENDAGERLSGITHTSIEREESGYPAKKQENQTDTANPQTGEDGQPWSQTVENTGENQTDTRIPQIAENSPAQSGTDRDTEDIEEGLAAYRAEREKGTSTVGSYTMVEVPNEENYGFGIGDLNGYTSRFDTKELNEAFKAAGAYLKDTLNLQSEVWACIDPRMTAIYEDEDKGVAGGYDADNIFLCEYSDHGNWQYLILVREGKGSAWKVLYHGNSYKCENYAQRQRGNGDESEKASMAGIPEIVE